MSSFFIVLVGFTTGLLIQKIRYENIKSYSGKEDRIVGNPIYPKKTNIKIFNANNVPGSEKVLGVFLQRKISGVHYHNQYQWVMRRIYNRTIIVYIKDDYRNRALQIAKLLPGQQTVIPYRNTPFFGLERRDIAIFVGKDLENRRWK